MKRVLVVDDDPSASRALGVLLDLDGYEAVVLNSPSTALARIAAEPFDAVITDLEMPELHGTDVIAAVRARSERTPVYVVTGYAASPASRRAEKLGARRVFGKPVDYD